MCVNIFIISSCVCVFVCVCRSPKVVLSRSRSECEDQGYSRDKEDSAYKATMHTLLQSFTRSLLLTAWHLTFILGIMSLLFVLWTSGMKLRSSDLVASSFHLLLHLLGPILILTQPWGMAHLVFTAVIWHRCVWGLWMCYFVWFCQNFTPTSNAVYGMWGCFTWVCVNPGPQFPNPKP